MQTFLAFCVLLLSYLIGSIPFGLLIVRMSTGKDVRQIESGRTGATNTMRAAGFWAGLSTALLDILKGASAVWMVRYLAANGLASSTPWLEILAPICAVLGHNYSLFLIERNENGKIRLRGGAGGTPAAGGAFALWPATAIFTLASGAIFLVLVGYASLATLSIGVITGIIFAYRAWLGLSPWQYILYSVAIFLIIAWALRPNIRRLLNGTERLVGIRARKKKAENQT